MAGAAPFAKSIRLTPELVGLLNEELGQISLCMILAHK